MKLARVVEAVDDARIELDLDAGCRLASLEIAGHEVLVGPSANPLEWGCYPMAPFAGRVRSGRFNFRGRDHELPRVLGGHAIHGTVFDRRWNKDGNWYETELGPDWPFPGWARQQIVLQPGQLTMRLEVHAATGAMPASCGWHPWFRRSIATSQLELDADLGFMFERDADGVASRRRLDISGGPWDDCFGEVSQPVRLVWPDVLRLDLTASSEFWVVFTEQDHAVCVEPQTAPPNALGDDAFVVEPGLPLVAEFTISWSPQTPGSGG